MRFGTFNRRIVIQSTTTSRNASGEVTDSWGTHATLWAQIVPVAGGEFFSADQLSVIADVRFRIWYLSTLTTKMRVSYNNTVYDIVRIDEIGLKMGQDVFCKVRPA
jgi:SPP1 family predicted phage head-tail adaptor